MLDIIDGWHQGERNGTEVLLYKNLQVQCRGGPLFLVYSAKKVEMLTRLESAKKMRGEKTTTKKKQFPSRLKDEVMTFILQHRMSTRALAWSCRVLLLLLPSHWPPVDG